jgi:hypothetical protein
MPIINGRWRMNSLGNLRRRSVTGKRHTIWTLKPIDRRGKEDSGNSLEERMA